MEVLIREDRDAAGKEINTVSIKYEMAIYAYTQMSL